MTDKKRIRLSPFTKLELEQILARVLVIVPRPQKDQGPTFEPTPSYTAPSDATIADQALTRITE